MLLNMFAMGHGLHSRVRQEVWKFLYDEWSCPHSIGLRPELREIYYYYEARAVPVQ